MQVKLTSKISLKNNKGEVYVLIVGYTENQNSHKNQNGGLIEKS